MTRDEVKAAIINLRETTDLSMSQIASELGLSKNVVQGVIYREAGELVVPKNGEPRTLFQRCDELHAKMDAVLAECKDIPRLPAGRNQHTVTTWAMPRSLTRGMMADD